MPDEAKTAESSENVFDSMEGRDAGNALTEEDFLTDEEKAAREQNDTEGTEKEENTEDAEEKEEEEEKKEGKEESTPSPSPEWGEQYGEDSQVAAGEMFKRNQELEAELNRMTGEQQAADLAAEAEAAPQISKEDVAKVMSEFDEKFSEKPAEAALEMISMMVNQTLPGAVKEIVDKALTPVFNHFAEQKAVVVKERANGLVGTKFGNELVRDAQAYLKQRPALRQYPDAQEMALDLVLSSEKWRTRTKESSFDAARAAEGKKRKASGPAGRTPESRKAKSALEKVQDEVMNAKVGKSLPWEE